MGLFDSSSRQATREYGDLYRDRADRLTTEAGTLLSEGRAEEAESRVRQLLALQEKFVGDRHPEYAAGLILLANTLTAKEELGDAETVLQRALELRKKTLGEKHPEYAEVLDLLGRLILRFEDFTGAEPLLEKALEIRKAALGVEHPNYAASLVAKAECHFRNSDLTGVEALLRTAIAIQRKALKEDHPDLSRSLTILGEVVQHEGRLGEAEDLFREVVDLLKSAVGERHPSHVASLASLAGILQRAGKLTEAEPIWRLILDMKKQSLGEFHHECAAVQIHLAQILQKQGDLKGAIATLRQVCECLKKSLGERHPEYATSLNQLAMLLQREGDLTGAEPLLRQALAVRKDVLGARHPDYATSLINLALLVQKRGDATWSKMLLKEAVEVRRATCGENHPDYATALASLADVLGQHGETGRAEELLRQSLAIRKETLGTTHPTYAANLSSLAAQLRKQGDFVGAEDLLRQALESRKTTLGEKHPDYATNLGNLAWLLQRRGDRKGAETLLKDALEIRRQLFGEAHPDYRQNLDRLQKLRDFEGNAGVAASPVPVVMPSPRHAISAVDSYDDVSPLATDDDRESELENREVLSLRIASTPAVLDVFGPASPDDHDENRKNELIPATCPGSSPIPEVPKPRAEEMETDTLFGLAEEMEPDTLFGGEIHAGMEMANSEPEPFSEPADHVHERECRERLHNHAEAITDDLREDREEDDEPAADAFAELLAAESRIAFRPLPEPEPDAPEVEYVVEASSLPFTFEITSEEETASEVSPPSVVSSRETPEEPSPTVSFLKSVVAHESEVMESPGDKSRSVDAESVMFEAPRIVETDALEDHSPSIEPRPGVPDTETLETLPPFKTLANAPSHKAPRDPVPTPARSPLMNHSSSHLSTELAALSDRFSELGERLLTAARQLHAPGVPPAEDLIEAVTASRAEFTSLRDRARELAASFDIHASEEDHLNNLQAVTGLLDQVAEAEIRRSKGEDTKRRAVAVLDRVLTLSHTSGSDFDPLRQVHEQAHALRGSISEGGWSNIHTDAEKLAEGEHHFADLLSLIEDRDELSDDLWASLHDNVTKAFGKSLAAAAARSKLVLPANTGEEHDLEGDNHHDEISHAEGGQRNNAAYFGMIR